MLKVLISLRTKASIKEMLDNDFPNVSFRFFSSMNEAENELYEADILVTYGDDLTSELLDKAVNLKWIMVLSAGMENLPFEKVKEKGIIVTNARGIHKAPMVEYAMGMMLQISRNSKELIQNESNSVWDRSVKVKELYESTVTILGVGEIGGEIARLSKAFGMKTIGVNRSGSSVGFVDEIYKVSEMDYAISQADYIISVLPSTKETKRLLTISHFERMKNSCIFINIGRGDLYEEGVLVKALEDGEIAHAVLDVFELEPLPKEHSFWNMAQVTITPHISGISKLYQVRGYEIFEYNLKQFLSGSNQYKNQINLDRGY